MIKITDDLYVAKKDIQALYASRDAAGTFTKIRVGGMSFNVDLDILEVKDRIENGSRVSRRWPAPLTGDSLG